MVPPRCNHGSWRVQRKVKICFGYISWCCFFEWVIYHGNSPSKKNNTSFGRRCLELFPSFWANPRKVVDLVGTCVQATPFQWMKSISPPSERIPNDSLAGTGQPFEVHVEVGHVHCDQKRLHSDCRWSRRFGCNPLIIQKDTKREYNSA